MTALPTPNTPQLFDHRLLKAHIERSQKNFQKHDFLHRLTAERLVERLGEEIQVDLPSVLDIGSHNNCLYDKLKESLTSSKITQYSFLENFVSDTEQIKLEPNSFSLIASSMSLHWINDVPGYISQIKNVLKNKGLFIAIFPGGNTLYELRDSLQKAEQELTGGISPRISPSIEVKDAGALLQRSGLHLPVAESDLITVCYSSIFKLMHELRGMGENSCLKEINKKIPPKSLFQLAEKHYKQNYSNNEGNLQATFELITMTGWKS